MDLLAGSAERISAVSVAGVVRLANGVVGVRQAVQPHRHGHRRALRIEHLNQVVKAHTGDAERTIGAVTTSTSTSIANMASNVTETISAATASASTSVGNLSSKLTETITGLKSAITGPTETITKLKSAVIVAPILAPCPARLSR